MRSVIKIYVPVILFIWVSGNLMAQSNQYLEIKASRGQTAFGLLRKYKLLDQSCHLDAFFVLNKMKPTETIIAEKKYKLPIKLVRFDGKSIRSSLNINDIKAAREIESYNQEILSENLRKQDYKKSKLLWVPLSFEGCNMISSSGKEKVVTKKDKHPTKYQEIAELTNQKPFSKKSGKKTLVAEQRMDSSEVASLYSKFLPEDSELVSTNRKSNIPLVKPVSGRTVTVDLFGKDKKEVVIESEALKNQVFYIVPGHGGPDPGAMVKHASGNTLCEDEYAYDVSLRLARNLIKHGAIVHIIVQDKQNGIRDDRYLDCDDNEKVMGDLLMPVNQKKRLRQGMAKVNQLYLTHKLDGLKKQWMISIHIDSQPEENRQDVFFYYQADSRKSKNKAHNLQKVFATKYKEFQGRDYNGSVSTRPLYVIRASNPDPIFVELANIRNPKDQERILSPKNRQVLADWMLEGFLN